MLVWTRARETLAERIQLISRRGPKPSYCRLKWKYASAKTAILSNANIPASWNKCPWSIPMSVPPLLIPHERSRNKTANASNPRAMKMCIRAFM